MVVNESLSFMTIEDPFFTVPSMVVEEDGLDTSPVQVSVQEARAVSALAELAEPFSAQTLFMEAQREPRYEPMFTGSGKVPHRGFSAQY
jgi:hypothetical protein